MENRENKIYAILMLVSGIVLAFICCVFLHNEGAAIFSLAVAICGAIIELDFKEGDISNDLDEWWRNDDNGRRKR